MAQVPQLIRRHPPTDHRFVTSAEVVDHEWYTARTSTDFPSTIKNYIDRDGDAFLRSTSKWNEGHLNAFKVIFLNGLPISRIIPVSTVPSDDDPAMQFANAEFNASEEDVRNNNYGFGSAMSFYSQLSKVIRHPGSPLFSSPVSRTLRPQTLATQVTGGAASVDLSSSESSYHPSSSSESHRESGPRSSEEDKPEIASNQMAVTLLDALCTVYNGFHRDPTRRISFRCSMDSSTNASQEAERPVMMFDGIIVNSVNDGSFILEAPSRRTGHWVRTEPYPRASLEVTPFHSFLHHR
jgi:hypothetical protein